jgi:hypothetical protein
VGLSYLEQGKQPGSGKSGEAAPTTVTIVIANTTTCRIFLNMMRSSVDLVACGYEEQTKVVAPGERKFASRFLESEQMSGALAQLSGVE